ncbi:serine hydrolase [Evansella sp. AB-rgal1]|uniref:serine hydrolase n=1 Tax=Evansella sp. AB-rgal1 TaxID=3242696 RepID=UPI00359EB8BB
MMIKKTGVLCLSILILFISFFIIGSTTTMANFDIGVDTAILVDADTGKILFEKNIDQPRQPASMVKMMSEYIILEAVHNGEINWDQLVPISPFVAEMSHEPGLSNVFLRVDGEYTVRDLYESVAIESANASTVALAELISGSEGRFVERMNEKGKELGLGKLLRDEGTGNLDDLAASRVGDFQFVNTTGLPNSLMNGNHPEGTGVDENNYMSARATATLAFHLINDFPEVLDTASIPQKIFMEGSGLDEMTMNNWNKMLPGSLVENWDYQHTDGLKTGFTNNAGYCFAGTAEREGQRVITVVMQADSEGHRFAETQKLMEFGFNNFSRQEIFPSEMVLEGYETLPVVKGKEDEVSISTTNNVTAFVHRDEVDSYSYRVELDESLLDEDGRLIAPIEANQVIGTMFVEYVGSGEENYIVGANPSARMVDITTNESVEKAGWFSLIMKNIGGFFSGIWSSVADTIRGWF